MSSGIYFIICSLVYSIMLTLVFFCKKRLKSFENKVYSFLVITNLCGIILELLCYFSVMNMDMFPILNFIISKLLVFYFTAWIGLFTTYIIVISFFQDEKFIEKIAKKKKSIINCCSILILLLLFLCLFLPLYYHNAGGKIYSYGPAVTVAFLFGFLNILVWLLCVVKNYKNLKSKKYLPLFVCILGGIVTIIIQNIYPESLLMTTLQTLITFLTYFTIENPDMKLIAELNIAKEQADKANHAKTDFLSNMSHEIRTPLNAIVGFSQALSEEDIPESAKEEVRDIVSASESLIEIVNGVLDISKIEANKLEIINTEYNFKKIYDDLISLVKVRIGEKPIELRLNYDESIPDVLYGDHVRIKQIILNLLTNSAKYTKEGYIDFKVSSIQKDGICRIIVSVEDSGIGIKKESIDKLFNKFERLGVERNTTIEGTGLGLAITKKLIELMNGRIIVQSVYGKGSRFTAVIDQRIVANKTLEDIQPKTNTVDLKVFDGANKKVLLVDDNTLNLKVGARLLKSYNIVPDEVNNGFDCIEKIKSGIKYDLILMDDMMPKMSGIETFHKLKEDPSYNIPTVALTANAIAGMKEKYLSEGFDDYLSKPIEKVELERVVKKYLS